MLARIALAAALLAAAPVEAAAHCYSVWRYPWPQRCGFSPTIAKQERRRAAPPISSHHFVDRPKMMGEPSIHLPSLARADLDGGAADEPTRARLLLRAVLGDPDVR